MAQPFDIPEGLFKRAEAAAEGAGISTRRFLLDAILEAVEDHEDSRAAAEAMRQIEAGEDHIVSAEEFWRGLDDRLPEGRAKAGR